MKRKEKSEEKGFGTKNIEGIVKTLTEAEDQKRLAEQELDYCDKKTQDLLHELELVEHSYHETARLSKDLKDIRMRRRVAKETIDLLTPVCEWKNEQSGAINRLNKVIGEMRKIDEKRKNAVYYYRADNAGKIIG